jgi:hypothetical protein
MAYKGHRSFHFGPWHNCSRCDTKTHISVLQWQRGLLLCKECYDTGNDGYPLVGQREAAIAGYLEHQTQELQPDPKLTDNNQIEGSMDEDLIV